MLFLLNSMSDENKEYKKKASEQSNIEGQRKEIQVESYPEAIALARMLEGVDFPTNKEKIIQHIEQKSGDNTADENVLMKLQKIEDKQYENVAEIAKNAGLVS
jgi:hypothetical protein